MSSFALLDVVDHAVDRALVELLVGDLLEVVVVDHRARLADRVAGAVAVVEAEDEAGQRRDEDPEDDSGDEAAAEAAPPLGCSNPQEAAQGDAAAERGNDHGRPDEHRNQGREARGVEVVNECEVVGQWVHDGDLSQPEYADRDSGARRRRR